MTTYDTPRVWVGCVACYADERLVGEWVDAINADTSTPCPSHDVFWVFYLDHCQGLSDGECSPIEVATAARLLAERNPPDWVALRAFLDHEGETMLTADTELMHRFTDSFQGRWASLESLLDKRIEEWMNGWPPLAVEYFNRDAYYRDARSDYWMVTDGDETLVFEDA